jgi:GH24 family phage-related lysozyme (muramidase)
MKFPIAARIAAVALAIAVPFIARWEGERYVAYQDVAGVWTICDGHTKGVKAGDRATKSQCEAWLKQDLGEAEAAIDRCIFAPLNANQRAALLSAVFNLGPRVVCDSVLEEYANAGDMAGACNQLPRWNRAGGRVVEGLTRRRIAERDLCLKADFSTVEGGVL